MNLQNIAITNTTLNVIINTMRILISGNALIHYASIIH